MDATPDRRLFFALWPASIARGRCLDVRARWSWPDAARLSRDDGLHVTLHFLGFVDAARAVALDDAGLAFEPFVLTLDRATVWPGGIAVLEPSAVPTALADLQRRLGHFLAANGFALESRPYRPHVTLARHAAGATPPEGFAIDWAVETMVLVESRPRGDYVPIRRWDADGRRIA